MKSRQIPPLILLISFTSSCVATSTPIATSTTVPSDTPTPTSTVTSSSTSTSTPTPIPLVDLEGLLFFDFNGSGLPDENEPLLGGLMVCVSLTGQDEICTKTEEGGRYIFEELSTIGKDFHLSIVDPNADNPDVAFRYINFWKGPVSIPAYEINGTDVPEQHLNDTEITSLEDGVDVIVGETNRTGLMQGFLTLPFNENDLPEPFVWGYFDITGSRIACGDSIPYIKDGFQQKYDGADQNGHPFEPKSGVNDGHPGLDYLVPIGIFIVHAGPKSTVFYLPEMDDGELHVHTMFQDPDGSEHYYRNGYGHLGAQLVKLNQIVHRGQIIALSGDTGSNNIYISPQLIPQLHFDLDRTTPEGCQHYLDPYRYLIEKPSVEDFSGSEVSYWTVDNDPQYP